jgi:acetoacetyl-CoA synthetase
VSTASTPLWQPSPERVEHATITRYRRWLEETRGLDLPGYRELWQWSVDDLDAFWASIWEFCDVRASAPYDRVLGSRRMPGAEWFPGARLNFAENLLARGHADAAVAIRHASELRPLGEVTWGELRAQTARVADALRRLGVQEGDRVVAYMPNVPETIAAFLACASLGAVWSGCSPDFGVRSVVDRFAQIEPAVLFAVDGYRYGGKDFDRRDVLERLQAAMPTLRTTVVLPYLDPAPELGALRDTVTFDDFVGAATGAPL